MDCKHSLAGDQDNCEFSCYEAFNDIKKAENYKQTINKALNYNDSYLCISKPIIPFKIEEKSKVDKHKFTLQPGEIFIENDRVAFFSNNRWTNIKGKLIITNYRLVFSPDDFTFLDKSSIRKDYFHFILTFIEEISFINKKEQDFPIEFRVFMKDMRFFTLKIQPAANFNFLKTFEYLLSRSKIEDFRSFFALIYHMETLKIHKSSELEWSLYDITNEMKRQGLKEKILMKTTENHFALWKLVDNNDFEICSTYPAQFIIPAKFPKAQMIKSSEFRTKNRLPVLVYALKINDFNKKNECKYVTLWRSSQIMMGIRSYRCIEDENLLKLMGDPNAEINEKETQDNNNTVVNLHIFDARSYSAALGNQLIGGGTESTTTYKNCELFYKNIENIHMVRESYKKLGDLCNNNHANCKWLSLLEETKWFEYLSSVLTAAKEVIVSFMKSISVLVHCSDGWDRTTQIISLAQIMIDPHFRTIKGFQNLIDKDWIRFGHKFRLRNGIGSNTDDKTQNSPIFLQFLDCVHQILKQYPSAFEFNLKYLSEIGKHCYSTKFGNFLCNCEKEMVENQIMKKTNSLWDFLKVEDFKNLFYEKAEYYLIPDTSISSIKLWEEWFMYHSKVLNKTSYKQTKEFYEEYYHCYYMNKKSQIMDSDYEIIDGNDI